MPDTPTEAGTEAAVKAALTRRCNAMFAALNAVHTHGLTPTVREFVAWAMSEAAYGEDLRALRLWESAVAVDAKIEAGKRLRPDMSYLDKRITI